MEHTHTTCCVCQVYMDAKNERSLYQDSNIGWANIGPTSGRQYRRWPNVEPTYVAVWVVTVCSLAQLRSTGIGERHATFQYTLPDERPSTGTWLSGAPDFFDRNKILSGYDLSHYQVPHCIRVFFYFVWFVFIHHNFQFYFKLCTYCNILDINLS